MSIDDGGRLHDQTVAELASVRAATEQFVTDRGRPDRVGRTASPHSLTARLSGVISPDGLGFDCAWQLFIEVVAGNTFDLDGPRFLAFIPMAPSSAAVAMDAAVGAASFSAESWLEAAGVVAAENQSLEFIRVLTGMPKGSAGAFCSGGSIGNLSAMAVARDRGHGRLCVVADSAHASVNRSAHLLGLELLVVPTSADGRLTESIVRSALRDVASTDVAVVVGSAGSTNAGAIDDLEGLANVAGDLGAWFHVDGAYGGAGLLLEECKDEFIGIGRADSFIVDPHKWLFSTAGSCALLYRDPSSAVATHRQSGPYIDVLHTQDAVETWNPSDYAFQLTRRASGLPFWFTLAVHGTEAMADAVRVGIRLAKYAAEQIEALPCASTVCDPSLGVVLFRREGWGADEWGAWGRSLAEGDVAFVAPTTWKGEVVGRLAFLHPLTSVEMVDEVIESLR